MAMMLFALGGGSLKASEAPLVSSVQQEGLVVKGVVLDQNGETLIGVNVLEEGTTNGTITDFDGNFVLKVTNKNAKIRVSYIGFDDQIAIVSI